MEKEVKKRARNRERAAQRRAMETEAERKQRLEASRRYSAEKRAKESEEKKAERRLVDRKRAAERRARESEMEREQRLALGRQRAAERRALESEKEREHRLGQNRKRLALKRASEAEGLNLPTMDMAQPTAARAGEEQAIFNCKEAEQTFQEVEQVTWALPVSDTEVKVDMAMASGPQQQPTAEQKTSSGGGEKSGEVKQEIVEITEYRAVEPNLERHYNELLKVIAEIGRDVKPAYTNNKVSTDRLRKNIMLARGVVRECVQDIDRLAAVAASSSSSSS